MTVTVFWLSARKFSYCHRNFPDANVAATYAGYTNFTYVGPTLVVSAAPVPVPAAFGLLMAPLVMLTRRRVTRA